MIATAMTIFLGFAAVLQGGLNRQIAMKWGITSAILLNCVVIFALSSIFFVMVKFFPQLFPTELRIKEFLGPFSWWFVLPGFFGLCLVAGIPLLIAEIGALRLFVGLVTGQIVGGFLWDLSQEGFSVTPARIGGAILAVVGLYLTSMK